MAELYKPVSAKKIFTTLESSEMIKYASNAFLATKISFINEIANVCENTGADVNVVAEGMGLDNRIGPKFLKAGLGYGGSCFPKDVRALHSIALNNGYDFRLLQSVIEVNNHQRRLLIRKITARLGDNLYKKEIAVFGLAFKDNTDDVRESAAVDIIKQLKQLGARVRAYDPKAVDNARVVLANKCRYHNDPYDAVRDADALIIATEWSEFREYDYDRIKSLMKQPLIFDGKNLLEKESLAKAGYDYVGMGR